MGERKRILLVKPVLPYPPNQGTKVVSFDLIRALSARHEVTVLARVLDSEEREQARDLEAHCARVVTVFPGNRKSFAHRVAYKIWYLAKSLFARRSMKSLYDCPGAFIAAARELARERFDLVIVEYWQLYPMLDVFPREALVLLTHDVDLLVNRRVALLERRLYRKLRAVRRWLIEQREEVRAYQRSPRIWVLTERDGLAVRKLAGEGTPVDVLPFGIDPAPAPGGSATRAGREVLFLGAMGAGFNQDAVSYFFHKIYPHIAGLEGLRVTVAGGELPRDVAGFASAPGVNVVGRVDDTGPLLARASCMVVPLRFGGGLRIRILEAMMAGLPVVCSSVAIAGMDFEPDRHFLLADEPGEIAGQILRLLSDAELRDAIATAAHARVAALYSRETQAERTRRLVESIVNK